MQSTDTTQVDVIVIGGGLSGLTTAALLARAGRSVRLFERARKLGGRAVTAEHHGFLFNRGVHALYLTGPGETVLRELGVAYSGGRSDRSVYEGEHAGMFDRLPLSAATLAKSRLLDAAAQSELAALLTNFRHSDPADLHGTSLQDWLDQSITQPMLRRFIEAGARLATYTHAPELLDAGFALKLVAGQPGVVLLDGGWQTLVDGLTSAARAAGAQLVSGARVAAVEIGATAHTVRLADGTALQAGAVVLATEPSVAAQLVAAGQHATLQRWAAQTVPLYVACLDIGLQRLPDPDRLVVLNFDRPLYYSVHSKNSRLAPADGALIHTVKYLRPGEKGDAQALRRELEEWLDRLQPGWRDLVVAQQFLPHIQVASDMIQARRGGPAGRPGPAIADLPNLYVVGDWVGKHDQLANAGFASAQQAAQLILSRAPAQL